MNSFMQYVAALIAAGSFGVAVIHTATFQSHSGAQTYVRVVR